MYCKTLVEKLYIIFVDLGGESMNSNDVKFIKQELVRVDKEFGPKTVNVKYFKYPDIEFAFVSGEQDIYPFILSVE